MNTEPTSKIIHADGTERPLAPANGTDFTLEELKEAIGGGHIEIVWLDGTRELMVCDEEGKLKSLAPNSRATLLARSQRAIESHDYVCGDVLVCPDEMVK